MVRYATVVKKGVFDAGHSNSGFGEGHKCSRIHGHTFNYEVHVRSKINEATGLSIDFGVIKQAMKEKVDNVLDHYYINEVPHFKENNIPPSAENIAYFIFEEVQLYLDRLHFIEQEIPDRAEVLKVVLNETPTSSIIINAEDVDGIYFRPEVSE